MFGQRGGMAVRQAEEHDVVAGAARSTSVGSSTRCGQRQQMRVVLAERGACTRRGGQRADGQPAVGVGGVPEQQPQDLAARISAGTGHRH